MQATEEKDVALKNRLAKVEMLETWVKSKLRPLIHDYLCQVSPDYRRGDEVRASLDKFRGQIDRYAGYLQAFARDLRGLVAAITSRAGQVAIAKCFSDLRDAAENLDCQALQLEIAAQRVSRAVEGSMFSEIKVYQPPFMAQAVYVDRMSKMDIESEVLGGAERAEAEVRNFLADGLTKLRIYTEASRERVSCVESEYLENYWQQLRTHAETHYVEERDLDEVLHELAERYVVRRQQESVTEDPFTYER